jgi:hypothetical protein
MLCKDCVSAKIIVDYHGKVLVSRCKHPDNCDTNPVTGELEMYSCELMNNHFKCKLGRIGTPEANRLPPIRSKNREGRAIYENIKRYI